MANNRYEIVMKNETQSSKSPIADNSQNTQSESTQKNGKLSRKDLAGYFAFKRVVAPFVRMGIEYGISTVNVRTGRAEAQQRIQFAYSVGRQVAGMAENILIGALVGGLPGAIVGAVMSTVTTVAGYAINQSKIDLQSNLENISLGLMNIRASGDVAAISGSRER